MLTGLTHENALFFSTARGTRRTRIGMVSAEIEYAKWPTKIRDAPDFGKIQRQPRHGIFGWRLETSHWQL
jgi:hypothetical protein